MNRRAFLCGLLAAPAVVRYGSIMPVRLPAILRPVTSTIALNTLPMFIAGRLAEAGDFSSGGIISVVPRIENGEAVGWDVVPATQEQVDRVLASSLGNMRGNEISNKLSY